MCQYQCYHCLRARCLGSDRQSRILEPRPRSWLLIPIPFDDPDDWVGGSSFFYSIQSLIIHRFGLTGLTRRWIVYPAALVWPTSLSSTVLFRALHEPESRTSANGWTITRYRFFAYITAFAFVLFWFPDYIWTSLSAFAFVTWIAPENQKVNTIFGVSSQ